MSEHTRLRAFWLPRGEQMSERLVQWVDARRRGDHAPYRIDHGVAALTIINNPWLGQRPLYCPKAGSVGQCYRPIANRRRRPRLPQAKPHIFFFRDQAAGGGEERSRGSARRRSERTATLPQFSSNRFIAAFQRWIYEKAWGETPEETDYLKDLPMESDHFPERRGRRS